MRSILVLLAIASIGFIVILQKKDASDPTLTKAKMSELQQGTKHNWMKHALEGSPAFAQNTTRTRKDN